MINHQASRESTSNHGQASCAIDQTALQTDGHAKPLEYLNETCPSGDSSGRGLELSQGRAFSMSEDRGCHAIVEGFNTPSASTLLRRQLQHGVAAPASFDDEESVWEDALDAIGAGASVRDLEALLSRAPNRESPTAQFLQGFLSASHA